MYGLIGRMTAAKGKREELAGILAGIGDMPGCLSYVVALEESDPQAIWVTEAWENAEAHQASLSLPKVQAAIEKGRPLIARFDQSIVTEIVGGID